MGKFDVVQHNSEIKSTENNEFSDFENTKMALYNAGEIKDIKNNPVVKTTILSVLKSIPILGELLDETFSVALTKFQEEKRAELIGIILRDSTNITTEMVNDIEFIMNFAKTLDAVNRLSSNDKIKYFANLIKNGYLKNNKIDDGEFEEYLFALSTLSYRQINILNDLYIYEKNVKSDDFKDGTKKNNKLAERRESWNLFIKDMTEKYSITEEDVQSILSSISSTGFCREITGAYYGYTGGTFYITDGCKKFIKMITDKNMQQDIQYYNGGKQK